VFGREIIEGQQHVAILINFAKGHGGFRTVGAGNHASRHSWVSTFIMVDQLDRHPQKCRKRTLRLSRLSLRSAGLNRPSTICYEWLLSSCCKCSEKQQAGSRLSLRLRNDWISAVKADLGHALLACVSFIDPRLRSVHVE